MGTAALLSHYSKKVGKLKFWIAMTLPLAFYLGQIVIISFQIPFPFLESDTTRSNLYSRVIFTISFYTRGLTI